MRTTTHLDHHDLGRGSHLGPSHEAPRRRGRFLGFTLATMLAIGTLGVAGGSLDAARADSVPSPTRSPGSATAKSRPFLGELYVDKGLRLTRTSLSLGSGTETGTALPEAVDATGHGRAFEFDYYTDCWFHMTEVETTYRVEGTNDEVWIKVTKRPLLDDITQYEIRNSTTHRKATNASVKVDYEQTAREHFYVEHRT